MVGQHSAMRESHSRLIDGQMVDPLHSPPFPDDKRRGVLLTLHVTPPPPRPLARWLVYCC